jgi:hypothetical protein
METILKFKMTAFTKLAKSINNALNRLLNPKHMCLGTKIKSICALQTEISARYQYDIIDSHLTIKDILI